MGNAGVVLPARDACRRAKLLPLADASSAIPTLPVEAEDYRSNASAVNMNIGHSFAALRQAAQAAVKEKAFERAEALYRELQAAHPHHPLGLVGQAQVAQMRWDWAAAVGLWEEAWERYPEGRRQDWLRAKAEALARLGRVGEAETLVGALIE